MAFIVVDRRTGKEADLEKITNEMWAADLLKFDEYEWFKSSSGQLILTDKLFNVAYPDPTRFVPMSEELYRQTITRDLSNYDDIEIGLDDGINSVGIYIGNLGDLHKVEMPRDRCKFYDDHAYFDSGFYVTLKDISDYYAYREDTIITVFVNAYTTGDIFQYGNYHEKHWYRLGKLKGYV